MESRQAGEPVGAEHGEWGGGGQQRGSAARKCCARLQPEETDRGLVSLSNTRGSIVIAGRHCYVTFQWPLPRTSARIFNVAASCECSR
jgi:hypothetical protein